MIDKIEKTLANLRAKKPLILCITNFVTMEFVANSLLSIGAAPIMSLCEEELEELVNIASYVYINIGTLDSKFISLAKAVIAAAKNLNKPIILDPVGCGATKIRTQTSIEMLPYANCVRGNSSEIISLKHNSNVTHGVESVNKVDEAKEIAKSIAKENNSVVVVSAEVDFVTNGHDDAHVTFGSAMMQKITGMGCSMTAVIAAFQAVVENTFEASVLAANYFALCGSIVELKRHSPGGFKVAFLDQLHNPNFELMRKIYDQRR